MKKAVPMFFIFFLLNAFCFGQLKFSANTGIMGINIDEIAWDKKSEDAQILSLLEWRTYAAPVISLYTQIKFADIFLFEIKGSYVIPFSYGQIEDFDYMNLLSTAGKERTHYSKHDNNLKNYINANLFFGAGNKILKNLNLSLLFSLKYSYYNLNAFNGYRQYGEVSGLAYNGENIYSPWKQSIEKKQMTGNIITLESHKLFFGIGSRLDYYPLDKLCISLNLDLLPALLSQTRDTHHKRKTPYSLFDFTGEFAFDSSLLVEYKITKNLAFTTVADFFFSTVKNASFYQSKNMETWKEAANPGGSKEFSWKCLLGVTYIYEK